MASKLGIKFNALGNSLSRLETLPNCKKAWKTKSNNYVTKNVSNVKNEDEQTTNLINYVSLMKGHQNFKRSDTRRNRKSRVY